jgi:hypothetical protein
MRVWNSNDDDNNDDDEDDDDNKTKLYKIIWNQTAMGCGTGNNPNNSPVSNWCGVEHTAVGNF